MEAPEIEVVEADRLHPDLNLARTRGRRRVQFDEVDLAIGD
jgi:hypothetical protein